MKSLLFQKVLLGIIFFLPYLLLLAFVDGEFILRTILLPLFPFLAAAIIVSEATKRNVPGTEDKFLMAVLLLSVFPFTLSLMKISAFLILAISAYLMLRDRS